MNRQKKGFGGCAIILLALALMWLCYDMWVVFTRTIDLNEHIPFLLSGVFGACALALWRIGIWWANLSPKQRHMVVTDTEAHSCLNPANTTRGNGIE